MEHHPAGHHKPVDVWAMGVITYFLLCGYTPFDKDSQAKETEAIIAGDYKFEPAEYWENVSKTAKDFIRCCLTVDPAKRPTAQDMLGHDWLLNIHPVSGTAPDLLPQVKKNFDARKACQSFYFYLTIDYVSSTLLNIVRKAVFIMMAMKRMTILASPNAEAFGHNLQQYKEESEKVRFLILSSPSPFLPADHLGHRKQWARMKWSSTTLTMGVKRYCLLTSQRQTEVILKPITSLLPFILLMLIIRSFYSIFSFRSHLPNAPSQHSKPVNVSRRFTRGAFFSHGILTFFLVYP